MQMYLDYKLNHKIPSDLPWLLTYSTPPFVSTNFETKPAPLRWGQCLCHFMMQSSINANHSPADSFHWKPNTSSRTTILHYLCPWTQSIRTALFCRKTIMRRDFFFNLSAKATTRRENYDGLVHLTKDSVTSIDQQEKNCDEQFQRLHIVFPKDCGCVSVSVLLFTHMSCRTFSWTCCTFAGSLGNWGIELGGAGELTCIQKDAPLAVQIWLVRKDLNGRLS